MVALARYLILDLKEMTEWRMLAVAAAIFLLTISVLAIRYGHVRFPYREDADENLGKPYVCSPDPEYTRCFVNVHHAG